MNLMTSIGAMLATTARSWSMPPCWLADDPPKPNGGRRRTAAQDRRKAAKARAQRRARRLNHYR
ncbi:hypothetical protein [Litchfieldella xinjiangensis]|uniref:hypothetical protein n=1 Tax=Litchfieldella xinjiangensis TaxID=1166948 RepID=UPI0005BDFCB2|nr:hypothetical protein [Halomonas xinjiangensis]